uniref:hypothetical protein n=1 Tax=Methylobacter marinus TaxID=34058 RepID=UPI0022B57783|nr:hypothetical protein [Methylobacter marinus]
MLAKKYGFFLPRGVSVSPLDTNKKWQFTPEIEIGGDIASRRGPGIGTGRPFQA